MRLDPGDSTCFFGGGVEGFLAKLETGNAKNIGFNPQLPDKLPTMFRFRL
jgi:hypothetical protein